MSKAKKGLPSPAEKPDLYDGYDGAGGTKLSQAYLDAVVPDHVKKALADRKTKVAA